MTTPIPIDVLAVFERCIRQAMDADPDGAALPAVPDSALRDAVEAWRVASPAPPAGATSLLEQTQAILTTLNRDLYEPFRLGLADGRIQQPRLAFGALRLEPVATVPPLNSTRALFLIEEYRLTSFLGRYGVGRTLSTMSLLPGEETIIRLKTWTTTSTTRTDTSSVVDSEEVTVSNKFATKLSEEASDTRSRQDSSSWHAEASGSATWGIGVSLEASAGASAETQTSRESFARTASEQVAENAREARSQRKTEVATSTTTVSTSGEEDYSERVVRNVNLRRTLNFVFRELNQEYITRLHMTGARVAEATPGQPGTWVEYPLSQLPELLKAAIAEHHWAEVAARVVANIATVNDAQLRPVQPLQVLTVNADGSMKAEVVTITADGVDQEQLPLPGSRRFLRWRPGPLAAEGDDTTTQTNEDPHAVDGVLLSEQPIVMPTGAIVVDAALGEHDALDEYAMRAQETQLADSEANVRRELLLNQALEKLEEPAARVDAYAHAKYGTDNHN